MSVRGVITSLSLTPRYSNEYSKSTSQMEVKTEFWSSRHMNLAFLSHSKSLGSLIFFLMRSSEVSLWWTYTVMQVSRFFLDSFGISLVVSRTISLRQLSTFFRVLDMIDLSFLADISPVCMSAVHWN